tara:strand:+ start:9196 stop:9675 length:480 start_codon:yes stop_codon:yes gene_type:complete
MRIFKRKISLFVYDFDGVMTDNRAMIFNSGEEAVLINRSDGLAIEKIKSLGILQIILSTEKNNIVLQRAKKLNIPAINGVSNKVKELKKFVEINEINLNETVFVGNDLNDLEVMNIVGIKIAPPDSAKEILNVADYITETKGGFGVIRELYSKLLEENK